MEGGYCNGIQCGTAASGETYRGIDRKQAGKNWKGWALIDAWKKKKGNVPYNYFFSVKDGKVGPEINALADEFWAGWWNQYGIGKLQNQHLAAMFYGWSAQGQNRAMADINAIAKQFGAKQFSSTTITDNVAAAINANLASAYSLLRNRLLKFYKDRGLTSISKNRVEVFPVSISNKKTVTLQKALGPLGWVAAAFGLSNL
ncbi:MAG: hypothetical protein LCH58_06090 [Bacteroidetes bacterium]|uniref:hypothetical protein n=1 Tax=Phnomibacter sp. TaxID=2836217 RepID=UPI002FDDF25F|nr:hypothetical protein [Bacteroidota bacterium]